MISNSKSLYRKYRPSDFESVSGHKNVLNILKTTIENSNFSHALLFTGQHGTGKTSVAKIFAKAINCENIQHGEPCGVCESCSQAQNNSHPDIFEIDAASNNGVDEIRNIKNNVLTLPIYGKYKVYIIDEVHMLSISAFNALLKTLEEPPKHVVFILATTEYNKIPNTIISRCQVFNFPKIDKRSLINRLKYIATREQSTVDEQVLNELYYLSDGSLRDAINNLEQMINMGHSNITIEEFKKVFTVATLQEKINLIFNVFTNKPSEIINYFENAVREGMNFDLLTLSLLDVLKEVIEYKMTNNDKFLVSLDKNEISKFGNIDIKILFELSSSLTEAYSKTRGTNVNSNYLLVNILKTITNISINEKMLSETTGDSINQEDFEEKRGNVYNSEISQKSTVENKIYESNDIDFNTLELKPDIDLPIDNIQNNENDSIIETIEESYTIDDKLSDDTVDSEVNKNIEKKHVATDLNDLQNLIANKIDEDNKINYPEVKFDDEVIVNAVIGSHFQKKLKESSEKIASWFNVDHEGKLLKPELASDFAMLFEMNVVAASESEIVIVSDEKILSKWLNNKMQTTVWREKFYDNFGKKISVIAISKLRWKQIGSLYKDEIAKLDLGTSNLKPYKKTDPDVFYQEIYQKIKEEISKESDVYKKAVETFGIPIKVVE